MLGPSLGLSAISAPELRNALKRCSSPRTWTTGPSLAAIGAGGQGRKEYRQVFIIKQRDLPGGTVDKNPSANVGDTGVIPGP